MIRFIYNLFWPLGLLIFLPGYFAKMIRRGGYREKFGQRLGIYDREVRNRLSIQRSLRATMSSVGWKVGSAPRRRKFPAAAQTSRGNRRGESSWRNSPAKKSRVRAAKTNYR